MARIEESIEIKRPVDKVFAYTTDAKNWPKWQSVILEAEQTSQGPMNVGTTFKGVSRMMGRSMKWTAITTEYESNKKWGKNITCGNMAIEEHVTYNPIEGGTAFTILYDMKAGGFLKLLSPLMAGSMRKETKKSLGNLKSILEAQAQ
jgi:uncharacterized protein YndB with AHSA1/START domain